ncbi:MAG TPA: hypothetical protein V6C58_10295 [Allocoleopsis sp.]
MTTLYEEIVSKCTPEQIAEKNYHTIAQIVSVGRTRSVPRTGEVGYGTVLETLGITMGNALLDFINANPAFKYVKPLLEQGRLILESALVQQTLTSLVGLDLGGGNVFTNAHLTALNTLRTEAAPVSWEQCQEAVERGA